MIRQDTCGGQEWFHNRIDVGLRPFRDALGLAWILFVATAFGGLGVQSVGGQWGGKGPLRLGLAWEGASVREMKG